MSKNAKPVVLCVDDDVAILESLKAILESSGYQVAEARSAKEGLKQFDAVKPSVVLVDLMMESVDSGIKFCEGLAGRGSTTPIYLLSSMGSELMETINHLDLGIKGVFDKPFQPKQILAAVKSAVG